jgi:hypothetical protein
MLTMLFVPLDPRGLQCSRIRATLRCALVVLSLGARAYALDTAATDAGTTDAASVTRAPISETDAADAGAAPAAEPALVVVDAATTAPVLREDAGVNKTDVAPEQSKPSTSEPNKTANQGSSDDDDDGQPLWTGTTRFASRFYEVGITAGMGGLLYAPDAGLVGMSGLSIQEHHGLLSKVGVALLVALGQSNSRYVGSTTTVEGNYIVRRDYYRSLTPEERAAQAAAVAAAINGEYTTTLTVYGRDFLGIGPGATQAAGAEFSLGVDFNTFDIGQLPSVLTIGFYAASLSAPASWKSPGSKVSEISYTNLGVVGRWHVPASRYADLFLEWDANVLQLFLAGDEARASGKLYTSPLKIGAYGHLTDRAYLRGQINMGGVGVGDGKIGAQLELGVRF